MHAWSARDPDPSCLRTSNALNAAVDVANNVTVAITTDKGLCGGINTSISKYARMTQYMFSGGAVGNGNIDLPLGCRQGAVIVSAAVEG